MIIKTPDKNIKFATRAIQCSMLNLLNAFSRMKRLPLLS